MEPQFSSPTMLSKFSVLLKLVALSLLANSCAGQLVSTCFAAPSDPNSASGTGNCTRFVNAFCDAEAQSVFSPDALLSQDMASRCFNLVDGLGRSWRKDRDRQRQHDRIHEFEPGDMLPALKGSFAPRISTLGRLPSIQKWLIMCAWVPIGMCN
ncbi:hypothetical protein C8R47DRAFT_219913 [Mycena vitilis]|nr:hypothetical protein C8R47DRAFT_219913 [Mycena vitilis]